MTDPAVKMRINRRVFQQYLDVALRKHGSVRRIANHVGVSHTLVHQIANKRGKTHVNLDTACRFEEFFESPRGIIFTPELLVAAHNTTTTAAA